jgi:hypothetical protein
MADQTRSGHELAASVVPAVPTRRCVPAGSRSIRVAAHVFRRRAPPPPRETAPGCDQVPFSQWPPMNPLRPIGANDARYSRTSSGTSTR